LIVCSFGLKKKKKKEGDLVEGDYTREEIKALEPSLEGVRENMELSVLVLVSGKREGGGSSRTKDVGEHIGRVDAKRGKVGWRDENEKPWYSLTTSI